MPRSISVQSAIVEVVRGPSVECRHLVDIVIADAEGSIVKMDSLQSFI